MKWAYHIIASAIYKIRLWLNKIREKKPERFDKAVKIATFLISFISCFAPALVTNNWSRAVLEFIVLSLILVFQWSTFTTRLVEKDRVIKSLMQTVEELTTKITNLNKDTDTFTSWVGEDEEKYRELNRRFDNLAGFSHSVSDHVKKLIARINKPLKPHIVEGITLFFQESLNAIETILTEQYGKDIRASIKITIDGNTLKTYARGKNNILSRGGQYRCSQLNDKEIEIEENYAYVAIVWREQQFFAEGNLLEMHNKFNPDDEFFCEYGDDYITIFCSTIVMPIRIPVYEDIPSGQNEPSQEILGLLCIDSDTETAEWSDVNIKEERAYHIIADYADSLAILLKEYRNAGREE